VSSRELTEWAEFYRAEAEAEQRHAEAEQRRQAGA
jgi:hypothetical protein